MTSIEVFVQFAALVVTPLKVTEGDDQQLGEGPKLVPTILT
jgi:hypothetical protein